MSRKNQCIFPKQQQALEEQTNEKKIFSQDIFEINYENKSKILYQENSISSDVKVNNYLCYQQGNKLRKVTEIIYEDKLIKIEDIFDVSLDLEKLKQKQLEKQAKRRLNKAQNTERVRIFSKNILSSGQMLKKKDKKNIVKNFVKLFMTWLEKKNSDPQIEKAVEILKQLLEAQNFNNRLMKKLITNQDINKIFYEFLEEDAQNQIRNSRIQDKQSHYEAVKLYMNLIKDASHSDISSYSENSQMNQELSSQNKQSSQNKTLLFNNICS